VLVVHHDHLESEKQADAPYLNGIHECGLDVLGRLDPRRAKRLRRKLHEPLVELVNGRRDIGFPKVWFVGVDSLNECESRVLLPSGFF
jgi:hypothetical protein